MRKATYLADAAWKAVPWAMRSDKSAKHYLVDILADIPGLLERVDALKAARRGHTPHEDDIEEDDKEEEKRQALLKDSLDVDKALDKWYAEYASDILLDLPVLLHGLDDTMSPGAASAVSAPTLAAAHIMTLYWTTCLAVATLVFTPLGLSGHHMHVDPDDCFRLIVRALSVFVRPGTGLFRVHLTTFPASAALLYADILPPGELLAEKRMLAARLADEECASIRRHISSLYPGKVEKLIETHLLHGDASDEGSAGEGSFIFSS